MEGYFDICWVCFPLRDGLDPLHGELSLARRQFFTSARKTVRVDSSHTIKGFSGRVRGRLSRRSLFWKKTVKGPSGGDVVLEEAFGQKDGWLVVCRNFQGVIVSRSFFDKDHRWLKSEYYEPWDAVTARVLFTPNEEGGVLRQDWDGEKKEYRSSPLFSAPYRSGTAGQNFIDSRLGQPQLLMLTTKGERCFIPQEQVEERERAAQGGGEEMELAPGWNIAEPSEPDDGPTVIFTSLDEYARIEPRQEEAPPEEELENGIPSKQKEPEEEDYAEPQALSPEEEAAVLAELGGRSPENTCESDSVEPEASAQENEAEPLVEPDISPEEIVCEGDSIEPEDSTQEDEAERLTEPDSSPEEIVREGDSVEPEAPGSNAADSLEIPAESTEAPLPEEDADELVRSILEEAGREADAPQDEPPSPEDSVEMILAQATAEQAIETGVLNGRGRTCQPNGMTSYEGEYAGGKRHGFGSYYYKDGNLCYAGSWKEDRRNGLGVSFRDSDHALHVACWEDGQPHGLVTLFHSDGSLRYSGWMENGKKEGAGVSIDSKDGAVFVGQWAGGEATGLGSAFDREGRLLYFGQWKDGKRHGHGTEFDLNGNVVFAGEFREGEYYDGVLYQKWKGEARK